MGEIYGDEERDVRLSNLWETAGICAGTRQGIDGTSLPVWEQAGRERAEQEGVCSDGSSRTRDSVKSRVAGRSGTREQESLSGVWVIRKRSIYVRVIYTYKV